jgi:hypothetical protein
MLVHNVVEVVKIVRRVDAEAAANVNVREDVLRGVLLDRDRNEVIKV